jgi:hypothetical protein
MKYLPLHQSICKADHKYFAKNYYDNIFKCELFKDVDLDQWYMLIHIFQTFMNDDIEINW